MRLQDRIERKGWAVTYCLSGWIFAEKNGVKIKSLSITDIYNNIKTKRV